MCIYIYTHTRIYIHNLPVDVRNCPLPFTGLFSTFFWFCDSGNDLHLNGSRPCSACRWTFPSTRKGASGFWSLLRPCENSKARLVFHLFRGWSWLITISRYAIKSQYINQSSNHIRIHNNLTMFTLSHVHRFFKAARHNLDPLRAACSNDWVHLSIRCF